MSAIRVVARQELKRLSKSRRFLVLMVLSYVLFTLALLTAWQQGQSYHQSYRQVMERQQHMWEHQGELNPHSATHLGLYAFKPWNPISSWDPGLLPYLGSAILMESHKQNFDRFRPAQDQIRMSRFAPITLATLFQYLVPLLIILWAYAMMADERENGTLKLLLVQGAQPLQLFLGKALALMAVVSALILPMLILSLALMASSGTVPWLSVAYFILSYALYWLLFIWLSLLVSSLANQSRNALIILLSIWFLNTLIVPKAALGWIQAFNPLPTAGEMQQQITKAQEALPDWEARTSLLKAKYLKQYNVKDIKQAPVNLEGAVLQDNEVDDSRIYAEYFGNLYQRYQSDSHFYRQLGWLFPAIAIQNWSQAIAGSDFNHHHHFLIAAENYRFEYVSFLNNTITKARNKQAFEYTVGNELWKSAPKFNYSGLDLERNLQTNQSSLASIVVWLALLMLMTPYLLKRMRVLA